MFRSNADIFAVILLCAAAFICSESRHIVVRDLMSQRTLVFEKHISGPSVEVLAPFCILGVNR